MKNVEVVAAAICQDGKVLAARRSYGEFKGGWEFPGGKIEPGETQEQAVVREIQEELSVTIEVLGKTGTIEYDYPGFHLTMHCFWARVKKGKIILKEHEEAQWVDKENIRDISWLPADIEFMEQVIINWENII